MIIYCHSDEKKVEKWFRRKCISAEILSREKSVPKMASKLGRWIRQEGSNKYEKLTPIFLSKIFDEFFTNKKNRCRKIMIQIFPKLCGTNFFRRKLIRKLIRPKTFSMKKIGADSAALFRTGKRISSMHLSKSAFTSIIKHVFVEAVLPKRVFDIRFQKT